MPSCLANSYLLEFTQKSTSSSLFILLFVFLLSPLLHFFYRDITNCYVIRICKYNFSFSLLMSESGMSVCDVHIMIVP
jgi:hypothetical protein